MSQIEKVEAAFLQLESKALRLRSGEEHAKNEALASIFRLNNEIGRIARAHLAPMELLRALQFDVNRITVALKSGDAKAVEESLQIVRNAISDFKSKMSVTGA